MAIGYMILQARTAHDAVPLSGVNIRILDGLGNRVYELTTDESGESEKVPLETISGDFSRNPYYSETPYISYYVMAQKPGFQSLSVADIPIYEGETAILPLTLLPMEENQRTPLLSEIYVGKPAVAMAAPRTQTGAPSGAYVLRQVVIPNPITVHLGSPSSSASNVSVSFPDYVKNVASSEIYPTWPDAALRANIYAIITFALNRVFTEWYRSKGYPFDITNSTAYDQYFVKGRPIYSSISRIVDEIFNEYVRRRGQNNPYFTSFCNGTTATCQGLSQWGTVTLADQEKHRFRFCAPIIPKISKLQRRILSPAYSLPIPAPRSDRAAADWMFRRFRPISTGSGEIIRRFPRLRTNPVYSETAQLRQSKSSKVCFS